MISPAQAAPADVEFAVSQRTRRPAPALTGSVPLWCGICILAAAVLAWDGRYAMDPDGLSYIDMAYLTSTQGWHHLINGYWSPLYPAILSVVYWFHPSLRHEFPAIQFVNWIIFCFATLCFAFFFRRWRSTALLFPTRSEPLLVPLAFSILLMGSAQFITVTRVGPDLLMAAFVFLAAGISCKLPRANDWTTHACLGVMLGLGCYAKTPMFAAAAILFAVLLVVLGGAGRLKLLAAAVPVFLIVTAPLIAAQSKLAGRFSIGQSGELNYAWQLDAVHPQFTTADPTLARYVGRARILTRTPTTLEFAQPAVGSFPLWFDPAFWYAETLTRFHFDLRRQFSLFKTNLMVYGGAIFYMGSLCGGALVLLLFRSKRSMRGSPIPLPLLAWAVCVLLLYCCIHTDYRYIGAFAVVFWLAAYGALAQGARRFVSKGVLAAAASGTYFRRSACGSRSPRPGTPGSNRHRRCIAQFGN